MKRSVLITAALGPLLASASAIAQAPPPLQAPNGYAPAAPYPYAYAYTYPYAYAPVPPPPRKGPPESVPAIIIGSSVAGLGVVSLVSSLFVVVVGTRCESEAILSVHCGDTQTARDVAGALALGGLGAVAVGVPLIIYGAQRKPAPTAELRFGPGTLAVTGRF